MRYILVSDMERCTDERSSTPPLNLKPKSKENGKQIAVSLYDMEDQVDISRSIPMSAIAEDTLYVSSTPPASKSRFA